MKDFAAKNPVWTFDLLYTYLKHPGDIVPGTKMTFVGLPSAQDRINIIAYLHTLGSTLPIPAPAPGSDAGGFRRARGWRRSGGVSGGAGRGAARPPAAQRRRRPASLRNAPSGPHRPRGSPGPSAPGG